MDIDEMRKIKAERGYSIDKLSQYSGVPAGTIIKIFNGETRNPRPATLAALERVLAGAESEFSGKAALYRKTAGDAKAFDVSDAGVLMVRQPQPQKMDPGEYDPNAETGYFTVDDLKAIPENERYELINGQIIRGEEPTLVHQSILLEFSVQCKTALDKLKGKCRFLFAPVGVEILKDKSNLFEPDAIIVCDEKKLTKRHVIGAPDFVLEILSPSNRHYDLHEKRVAYIAANVKEYWIIDPDNKTLTIYRADNEYRMQVKALKGKQRLAISDGLIEIDLNKIVDLITE